MEGKGGVRKEKEGKAELSGRQEVEWRATGEGSGRRKERVVDGTATRSVQD